MSFWELQVAEPQRPALLWGINADTCQSISYQQLAQQVGDFVSYLSYSADKQLGLLFCHNISQSIVVYLSALQAGHAVLLLNSSSDKRALDDIIASYQPDWIFGLNSSQDLWPADYNLITEYDGWQLLRAQQPALRAVHADLAVLLSTSGTTGSAKMVKLSYRNLQVNAASIVEYLAISQADRSITSLPFNYSFGLSIVNSYLQAGGALVLSDDSLMNQEFWQCLSYHQVTSFSGVPYMYQMLYRLKPDKLDLSSVRTMTQAGGKLSEKLVKYFGEFAESQDKLFYVMYGQTEAAPRISYVPPHQLKDKSGSIGIAIPGGKMSISENGELIYQGENVMMGYACQGDDLVVGDEMHGVLHTGDLAEFDEDGFFYLRGRLKRFIKIHGNRISLDDIEHKLENDLQVSVAVSGEDDRLLVWISDHVNIESVRSILSDHYHFHSSTFCIEHVPAIPVNSYGKKDYSGMS